MSNQKNVDLKEKGNSPMLLNTLPPSKAGYDVASTVSKIFLRGLPQLERLNHPTFKILNTISFRKFSVRQPDR